MSSLAPCFTEGSIVRCKTCFGDTISGEVVAFDLGVKMLMLKCPASKGGGDEQNICNLTIVNLSLCMDIEIVMELLPKVEVSPPESINLQLIQERLRRATENRDLISKSYNANASPLAQSLFRVMVKHFGDSRVIWTEQGDNPPIQVMQQVTIGAPYAMENISCGGNVPKLLFYIQQIVESFHRKQ
ncbi:hypothetical protein KR009_000073 [Drosophila setifemur]|nr:hypothetical protein KR009_000073 [Drosophila setifemur]